MKKFLPAILLLLFVTGCQKSNTVVTPAIVHVDPSSGSTGLYVYIYGGGFDSTGTTNSVSFNGINAPVIDHYGDSILVVRVPPGVSTGKITVTSRNQKTVTANDFVILPGTWIQKRGFPDPSGRFLATGFAIGNKGYIGFGGHTGYPTDGLFIYDPVSDGWTQQASLGMPLMGAIGVVVQNKAYIGIGKTNPDILQNEYTNKFFEYDPIANSYTAKADFPGDKRLGAVGFALGNKVYVALGVAPDNYNDLWQYDLATDVWARKADCPDPAAYANFALGFALNDSIAYLGSGAYGGPSVRWWSYNAHTDHWARMNDLPYSLSWGPLTLVIAGNGYVFNGWNENWMYQASTDQWIQKAFPTDRSDGAGFVIGSKGYFGLGTGIQLPSENHYINIDLWEYTP